MLIEKESFHNYYQLLAKIFQILLPAIMGAIYESKLKPTLIHKCVCVCVLRVYKMKGYWSFRIYLLLHLNWFTIILLWLEYMGNPT